MTENQLQYACIEYMHVAALPGVIYFHIPNEGDRTRGQKIHMWRMGLLPGFPDLGFIKGNQIDLIEMKVSGGSLSDDQWTVRRRAEAQGIRYAVIRTVDDFIAKMKEWRLVK